MPRFTVQYATPAGKMGAETLEANSERAAIAHIEDSGRTPISVKIAGAGDGKEKSGSGGRSLRIRKTKGGGAMRRAVLDFTHQMHAIAESGIPIIAGLKAVAEQTGHPTLRAAVVRIIGRIEGGRTLADAMDVEEGVFPEIYVKTLAAGETAGKIPEVLASLIRYLEQEAQTRSQIRAALLYPALVVGTLVIATIIMLLFVVPQFAKMFEQFQGELPLPTRILLSISGALTSHYILVLIGLIGGGLLLRHALTFKVVRSWIDERILGFPVFGNLLLGVYMVRLIELLDLLTEAALPITQALRVTADSMTNQSLKADVLSILHNVGGGRSLSEAFSSTKRLTPLVKRMLSIGEEAGRTDQIFNYLKKFYANQTERGIKLLSTLIEPVLICGLAGVVLFFALSIFLPMWKLLKLVGTA